VPTLVQGDMGRFLAIISSAWAWLVANGLVGPRPDQDLGWYSFTKRGAELVQMEPPAALARMRAEDRLAVDLTSLRALQRSTPSGNCPLAEAMPPDGAETISTGVRGV
jgi:hypothetical protein